jgi:hypothetical protein
MPLRRLPSLRAALIASTLALPIFAGGALAPALPVEAQADSLQATVDDFVAYLKSETNEAARTAARIARENKDTIDAAKSQLGSLTADWGAALSRQKETEDTAQRRVSDVGGLERDGRLVMGRGGATGSHGS